MQSDAIAETDSVSVAEDPELKPEEKETLIGFSKADERLRIHSEQAAVVRWLLQHPEYREESRRRSDGQQHATTGTLPVGCLKLSGESRSSSRPSDVTGSLPNQ